MKQENIYNLFDNISYDGEKIKKKKHEKQTICKLGKHDEKNLFFMFNSH